MNAPMMESACPACGEDPIRKTAGIREEVDLGAAVPLDGTLLTCRCGFTGVWEGSYWRSTSEVEFDALLNSTDFLHTKLSQIWAGLVMQCDAERMEEIIRRVLDRYPFGAKGLERATGELMSELRLAGFHTHRNLAEWPDEGDD